MASTRTCTRCGSPLTSGIPAGHCPDCLLQLALNPGALEATTTNYASKSYAVFLQGSYGNDTNIYAESDVDVVIRLDSVYHYDTTSLTPQDLATFEANSTPGTYPYATFKADVTAALRASFGAPFVKPGTRAITIFPNENRRNADHDVRPAPVSPILTPSLIRREILL